MCVSTSARFPIEARKPQCIPSRVARELAGALVLLALTRRRSCPPLTGASFFWNGKVGRIVGSPTPAYGEFPLILRVQQQKQQQCASLPVSLRPGFHFFLVLRVIFVLGTIYLPLVREGQSYFIYTNLRDNSFILRYICTRPEKETESIITTHLTKKITLD